MCIWKCWCYEAKHFISNLKINKLSEIGQMRYIVKGTDRLCKVVELSMQCCGTSLIELNIIINRAKSPSPCSRSLWVPLNKNTVLFRFNNIPDACCTKRTGSEENSRIFDQKDEERWGYVLSLQDLHQVQDTSYYSGTSASYRYFCREILPFPLN